jgi:sugar phosphate isomerase/epimerase
MCTAPLRGALVPDPRPVLASTGPFYMYSLEETFEVLAEAGFDGVELMITQDRLSQDPHRLAALAARYQLPVPAIHGPFLLATWLVWGTDPRGKIERSLGFAETIGASTIVVHPPYRWQARYSSWLEARIATAMRDTGVAIAVENMFPVWVNGRPLPFQSGIELAELERWPYVTLDLSHLAVAGIDLFEAQEQLGEQVVHVHASNNAGRGRDTHAPLDQGVLPVREFLERLGQTRFAGAVTLELDVRHWWEDRAGLIDMLRDNLETARKHLAAGAERAEA